MLIPQQNGAPVGFPIIIDTAEVRAGIQTAMGLGIPDDPSERLIFEVAPTVTAWVHADGTPVTRFDDAGFPFDREARPAAGQAGTQTASDVLYGVEYLDANGTPTRVGEVAVSHLIVTVMDDVYDQVKDSVAVVAGSERYLYARTEPVVALGAVKFYRMHFDAIREQ